MSGRTFGQIRLHYSNALMLKLAMRGYAYFGNWAREVGYGDLASGHNANLVSLPNGWWAVQSVVQEADFVDDPSTPGVDYRNLAELEYSVPSDGVRRAAVEVVHRYQ